MESNEEQLELAVAGAKTKYIFRDLASMCKPGRCNKEIIEKIVQTTLDVCTELSSDYKPQWKRSRDLSDEVAEKMKRIRRAIAKPMVQTLSYFHRAAKHTFIVEKILAILKHFVRKSYIWNYAHDAQEDLYNLGLTPLLLQILLDARGSNETERSIAFELLDSVATEAQIARYMYNDNVATILMDIVTVHSSDSHIQMCCGILERMSTGYQTSWSESLYDAGVVEFLLQFMKSESVSVSSKVAALKAAKGICVRGNVGRMCADNDLVGAIFIMLKQPPSTVTSDLKHRAIELLEALTKEEDRPNVGSLRRLESLGIQEAVLRVWRSHGGDSYEDKEIAETNTNESEEEKRAKQALKQTHLGIRTIAFGIFCNLAMAIEESDSAKALALYSDGIGTVFLKAQSNKLNIMGGPEFKKNAIRAMACLMRASPDVAAKLCDGGVITTIIESLKEKYGFFHGHGESAVQSMLIMASRDANRLRMYQDGAAQAMLWVRSKSNGSSCWETAREVFLLLGQNEEVAKLMGDAGLSWPQ